MENKSLAIGDVLCSQRSVGLYPGTQLRDDAVGQLRQEEVDYANKRKVPV